MVRLSSERGVVQNPFIRYATEVGWRYLDPEEALRLRLGESSPLLWEIFLERVQALNPGIVDHLKAEELGKRLTRVRPAIEGNLDTWEHLRRLKTVFVEPERRERNLLLLDLEELRGNVFHVTDEFPFDNGTYRSGRLPEKLVEVAPQSIAGRGSWRKSRCSSGISSATIRRRRGSWCAPWKSWSGTANRRQNMKATWIYDTGPPWKPALHAIFICSCGTPDLLSPTKA